MFSFHVLAAAIVACSTLSNTCPDCGRVIINDDERARHIELGEGCHDGECAGCGAVHECDVHILEEINPDTGHTPLVVVMCASCWAKYLGPDRDMYAWGA